MIGTLRLAARRLARTPAFSAAAVLVLAGAIGLNTAAFSAVNALLFRPLPYEAADRLVVIGERNLRTGLRAGTSLAAWRDRSTGLRSIETLAAVQTGLALPLDGTDRSLTVAYVTPNFFEVVGPPVRAGRIATAGDARGEGDAIMVGEAAWRDHLRGGEPSGSWLTIGGRRVAVVGVLGSEFRLAHARADAWMPFPPDAMVNRADRAVWLVGRLRPGATAEDAAAELGLRTHSARDQGPTDARDWTPWVQTMRRFALAERGPLAVLLMAAVGVVLLIACFNLATMQLARSAARRREVAVCLALGAGRRHVAASVLAEALLLASVGGTAAVLLTWGARQLAVASVPELRDLVIDGRVLAVTSAVTTLAAVLFGVVPALLAARVDVGAVLQSAGTGGATAGMRFRTACLVVQAAGAVALLVGAGVLVAGFAQLTATEPGFRTDHVLVAELTLPRALVRDAEAGRETAARLEQQIAGMPGVKGVALASSLPFFGVDVRRVTTGGGDRERSVDAVCRVVTHSYFRVYAIGIRAGRAFTAADREGAPPVAVISQRMAELGWPGANPVGERVVVDGEVLTIVGVASDVRAVGLRRPVTPEIYRPLRQKPPSALSVAVHTGADPRADVAPLRRAVNELHPGAAVAYVNTMEALLDEQVALVRWLGVVAALLGGLALALSSAGLYGTMAFVVGQRTRELGIRVALGASPAAMARLVIGWAGRIVAGGVVLGSLGGLALAAALRTVLLGVAPPTIAVLAPAIAIVAASAALAAWSPIALAARIDPVVTLRHE